MFANLKIGGALVALVCIAVAPKSTWFHVVPFSAIVGSGDFLPPSPPGEKASARQDQTGEASARNWAGNGYRWKKPANRS